MFDHKDAFKNPIVWAGIAVLLCVGLSASVLLLVLGGRSVFPAYKGPMVKAPSERETKGGALSSPLTIPRSKDRSGLASVMSPDGNWRLLVEDAGSQDVSVEHSLVLRKTSGTGKRLVLASVADDLGTQIKDIKLHQWEPAGWSADASTVYFAERILSLGAKASEMPPSVFGNELYSVAAKVGAKVAHLGTFSTGKDAERNGLVAVAPAVKRAAWLEDGALYVAAFDGKGKTKLYEPPQGSRIWQAVYDPAGKRVAVLLMSLDKEEYQWKAGLLDAKGAYTDLGPSVYGGLLDWTKASGLSYLSSQPDGSFQSKTADGTKE